MMNAPIFVESYKQITFLKNDWTWIMGTGLIYLILGFVAISMPIVSTLGLTIALASILLVGGAIHFIQSLRLRNRRGGAERIFQSLVAILAGGLMLWYPGEGMMGIGLALCFYFFLGSASQLAVYSSIRSHKGSGWILTSCLVSFLLGVYMLWSFPFSALWVPGALLGLELMLSGCFMIGFSLSVRALMKDHNIKLSSDRRHAA